MTGEHTEQTEHTDHVDDIDRESRARTTGTPRRHRTPAVIAVLASFLLAATLLTACSSARVDLGTTDESCYLALPTAAKAVGPHAHLEGVRKFSLTSLKSVAPRLYGRFAHDVPKGKDVCVAAYTGHFTKSSVSKPLGRDAGTLAVAIVTTPGNDLLATLVLKKIPVRFRHII
jgi:hypothetical protein